MSDEDFKKLLEQNNAVLFGQFSRYIDRQLHDLRGEVDAKLDGIKNTVDGIAKHLDENDTDNAAQDAQLSRHDAWLHELADSTHLTLSHD